MLIRQACAADVPQLLALMRELAAFEDYLAQFAVDEQALRQRAFGPAAQCQAFIAEAEGELLGYALALLIPFTYDLRPTARLKELYVRPARDVGWPQGRHGAEGMLQALQMRQQNTK